MALTERWKDSTVASVLASRGTSDAGAPFVLFEDEVVTFGQVESRAEALAASLHNLGVETGDRIAVVLPACPEFLVAVFAAAKLGAVLVPMNPRLTVPEVRYMLRHSEAVAAVTVERYHGTDFLHLFEELISQLPELQYVVTVGEEDLWYDDRIFQLEDLLSAGEGRDYEAAGLDPESALFAILYTSGTTGKPKGVRLTHANVLGAAAAGVEALGLTAEDRLAGVTGLFHAFGIVHGILGPILTGASLVLHDGFDGAGVLDLMARHSVTVQLSVPALLRVQAYEQEKDPRDLSALRLVVAAGAPIEAELFERVRSSMESEIAVAYGLTETGGAVAVALPQDGEENVRQTVGRAVPGVELRIVDPGGVQLPVESVGEIAVRGPGVMVGYHRQPVETAGAMDSEGFLLTGDLGMLDEMGFLHLVGRRKEVIIRSGFSVHPREVEERLLVHPAVQDAVVVGLADDALGEALCACVVPVEGAIVDGDEIVQWCSLTLADYKTPDLVRFLDAFPLTGTGKVRRAELSRMVRAQELSQPDTGA
jgi:fatty-acyl-CoA synthase